MTNKKEVKVFIPFETPLNNLNGNILSKNCDISFSQQCQCRIKESHRDENGITIITEFEKVGLPQPITRCSFRIENDG